MNCPIQSGENEGWLLDYAAGKLDAGTHAALADHMLECAACREFAGGQQAVWQALEGWDAAPVPMDFDRRLYQRIEAQTSWWERFTQSLNPLFRHAVPVAAGAGVLLMAGLLLDRPVVHPVAPVQKTAQLESLQPDQLENALNDMEMLREFNHLVRADDAGEKM